MKYKVIGTALMCCALLGQTVDPAAAEDRTLSVSYHYPGGVGDMRDEMMIAMQKEVAAANVGLQLRLYPNASLYKPHDQWNALVRGRLDISAFPLTYAAGKHPEFNITLMPAMVRSHAHAARLSKSKYMDAIRKIIEDSGAVILADTWVSGALASTKGCILEPADVKGQVIRAGGKTFEQMFQGAGASITSMPGTEFYSSLQTGILDALMTSSQGFMTYRIQELVKCITVPSETTALWFMYQPVLLSKDTWNSLNDAQKKVMKTAGEHAARFADEQARIGDAELSKVFAAAGVKVVSMTDEQFEKWRDLAKTTSYKKFVDEVKGGKELLDLALEVK